MRLIQNILFEDESIICDYLDMGEAWFDHQKTATSLENIIVWKSWATLSTKNGDIYHEAHETYNAQRLL